MNDIIEKITKLFALSQSSNEHEAKLALSKAYELMERYQITMKDVDEAGNPYSKKIIVPSMRETDEEIYVNTILIRFFHVKIVTMKNSLIGYKHALCILGKHHNVAIAEHVFIYLKREFKSLWTKNSKRMITKRMGSKRKSKICKSYYHGLYIGLCNKMEELKNQMQSEYGLVVVDDVGLDEFKKKVFPDAKQKKQSLKPDMLAAMIGRSHGKEIQLNHSLTTNSNTQRLLPETVQ